MGEKMSKKSYEELRRKIEEELGIYVAYISEANGFFFGAEYTGKRRLVEGRVDLYTGEIKEVEYKNTPEPEYEGGARDIPLPDDEYTGYEMMAIEREYEYTHNI